MNRTTKILPSIIHVDQSYTIEKRSIDFSNGNNRPQAIVSLDQAKAFDRVNHS